MTIERLKYLSILNNNMKFSYTFSKQLIDRYPEESIWCVERIRGRHDIITDEIFINLSAKQFKVDLILLPLLLNNSISHETIHGTISYEIGNVLYQGEELIVQLLCNQIEYSEFKEEFYNGNR